MVLYYLQGNSDQTELSCKVCFYFNDISMTIFLYISQIIQMLNAKGYILKSFLYIAVLLHWFTPEIPKAWWWLLHFGIKPRLICQDNPSELYQIIKYLQKHPTHTTSWGQVKGSVSRHLCCCNGAFLLNWEAENLSQLVLSTGTSPEVSEPNPRWLLCARTEWKL